MELPLKKKKNKFKFETEKLTHLSVQREDGAQRTEDAVIKLSLPPGHMISFVIYPEDKSPYVFCHCYQQDLP